MRDFVEAMIRPLRQRLQNIVARGIITLISDGKGLQKVQATFLADETLDGLDRVQQFGFASTPSPGAECVAIFLGGNRDHGVVIATDDRKVRPQDIPDGATAIYSKGKYQVRVLTDKLQVGKDGDWETVVVGETLAELLGHLIDDLSQHTHMAPGAPPTTAAAIEARKTSYITNDKILAKDGGRF